MNICQQKLNAISYFPKTLIPHKFYTQYLINIDTDMILKQVVILITLVLTILKEIMFK